MASLIWLICTGANRRQDAAEFGRGYAFAHLHVAKALILDASVAALQLGVLGWLGSTGRLSVGPAASAVPARQRASSGCTARGRIS